MHVQQTLVVAVLAAAVVGLMAPALAQQTPDVPRDQGMDMRHGMMGQGPVADGMMRSGCAGMMQSMSGGDGRPNSQWPTHRPGGGPMVN